MSTAAVIFKVSNRKTYCLVKHFDFLKNVCIQYLNFMLGVTYRFFCFLFFVLFLQAAD